MSRNGNGHFVFVESNTTGTGRLAVERLLGRGDDVTFLTRQPEKYPFLSEPTANLRVCRVETNDPGLVASRVSELKRTTGVDAVLTFSEFYVPAVAEVAARCGFRYLDPAAARTCRNKYETRRVLRAAGLPVPDFRLVSTLEEAREAGDRLVYPCVVKPPADSSSKGVRLVESRDELLAHFERLHSWRTNDRGQPLTGEVLIESLLDGEEYSVETVTLSPAETRVVGVTAKHLSAPPHFVETGHDFPAELDARRAESLTEAVSAALRAVGFDWGPAHTEVRMTARGPVVVEINPRLAGGMIPELVRYATGLDLLSIFLDLLRGKLASLEPTREAFASIRFLTGNRWGRISRIEGLEEARGLEAVEDVSVYKSVGAPVQPAEEATHRLGHVITRGKERRRVTEQAEQARNLVRIILEN